MRTIQYLRLKTLILGILAIGHSATSQAEVTSDFHREDTVRKIAFGSCFDPRKDRSPMFDAILDHNPDVFVFLGDNIYGDTEDMNLLRKKWNELGDLKGFQKLRDNSTILATWDDHDYGVNDGGKSYKKRRESQQIFLNFFGDGPNSPRRQRDGVYGSYTFGTPGKIVQILLLDTRYFRDELPRKAGPKAEGTVGWYEPVEDTSLTLLGDKQWQWLEDQLQVTADVRIIASSIQLLAFEKGMENWGNVPHERRRLFQLLKKYKADHTFAISGDVHFAELSKLDLGNYPFYDLTSSGMTNISKGWANAKNSFRVGKAHPVQNAGLIEIDWQNKFINLNIITKNGEKALQHRMDFAELKFK